MTRTLTVFASSTKNGPSTVDSVAPWSSMSGTVVMLRSIFRTYWGLGVIDHVHQRADPENIAEEDELLSQIGTSLPNRREELYSAPVFLSFNAFPRSNTCSSSHPLIGCQPNLTDKGVQMLDEAFVNEALP